jgi:hypothetical protein
VVLFVFLDFGTVPVGTVPKSRKTNNTTLLEQFQNLEKQVIPHCYSMVLFFFLDFGTVSTVWYYLFF